jgi:hypothetical protein
VDHFAASTVYTATVTLTAKPGYTFEGVAANAFSHGTVTGTNAADGNVVTLAFPATGAAMGSIAIAIGFDYGAITVNGSDGTNSISQPAGSLTLSVAGYSAPIAWYVDGGVTAVSTANPVTLKAADYAAGPHGVTFTGKKNGITYSQIVPFAVAAGGGAQVITDVSQVAAYLSAAAEAGTTADPVPLAAQLDLATDWAALLTALAGQSKHVALDLSASTSAAEFDPGTANTGESKIVSLVLPDTATSIINGSSSAGSFLFRFFTELKSITGNEVVTIGNYCFRAVTKLEEASFPNATTSGTALFAGCTSLTTVFLPKVTSMSFAFFGQSTADTTLNVTFGSAPPTVSNGFTGSTLNSSNIKIVNVRVPSAAAASYNTQKEWVNSFTGSLSDYLTVNIVTY